MGDRRARSEVAVIRPLPMALQAALQNGPAAPELAADAYDCIMVRSSEGSTEYKAVAPNQRSQRELASDFRRRVVLGLTAQRPKQEESSCHECRDTARRTPLAG